MSDFIKIGNRIINKAHIISAALEQYHPDYGESYPRLRITLSGTEPGDYGQYSMRLSYSKSEATALWEQLQHYLAPTVIQIPSND